MSEAEFINMVKYTPVKEGENEKERVFLKTLINGADDSKISEYFQDIKKALNNNGDFAMLINNNPLE